MKKILIALLFAFLTVSVSGAHHIEGGKLKLGFMPYLTAQQILGKYQPLADYLSRELGVDVVIDVAKDYSEHLEKTGKDMLDISFLGGSPYVEISEEYGAKPLLVRYEFDGRPSFRSVIFTAGDRTINDVKDLKGKSVVFGSPKSTLSTQVPYYMLMEAGLKKEDIKKISFLNNHENVIYSVLLGEYTAGAVAEEIYNENKHQGIKAIGYSPYLSTHVFVTRSDMEPDIINNIKKSLLKLKTLPEGEEILKSISPTLTGFVEVKDSDYDLLRKILKRVLPELE